MVLAYEESCGMLFSEEYLLCVAQVFVLHVFQRGGKIQMKAIVYTSNAGSTARYAELLAQATGLPVYSAGEAKKELPSGSDIIYMGWLMASGIKGYQASAKRYNVCAVCGVGMGETGTQTDVVRNRNTIPSEIPLFTLQGNFNIEKLHGVYKVMMRIMVKAAGKDLSEKTDRTPEEDNLLDMMLHGGEHVSMDNLKAVLEWYDSQK